MRREGIALGGAARDTFLDDHCNRVLERRRSSQSARAAQGRTARLDDLSDRVEEGVAGGATEVDTRQWERLTDLLGK
jgi:hypothetical protein